MGSIIYAEAGLKVSVIITFNLMRGCLNRVWALSLSITYGRGLGVEQRYRLNNNTENVGHSCRVITLPILLQSYAARAYVRVLVSAHTGAIFKASVNSHVLLVEPSSATGAPVK